MPKVWFKAGILPEILEEFVCRRCGYTWKTEAPQNTNGGKTRSKAKIEKTCSNRSFWGVNKVMVLRSRPNCKAIINISQTKGLGDPEYGCTFEPFDFINGSIAKGSRKVSGETQKGGEA